MNSVASIKNLKSAGVGLRFEDLHDLQNIKPLGPPRPKLQIQKQYSVKGKTVSRNFNPNMYKNADWLCGCDTSNSLFCFVCLLMGSSDLDPAWVQTGVTDLKHLTEKIKQHSVSHKHLCCSIEFATLGHVDIRNQQSVQLIVFRYKNRMNKLNKIDIF
jgi:hypothetical protein